MSQLGRFRTLFIIGFIASNLFSFDISHAVIATTKHDFTPSGGSPIPGVTELCSTCHLPHRTTLNTPLWAHELSTVTYALYNQNSGYEGSGGTYASSPTDFLGKKSRLCLSCHDGSLAVADSVYITQSDSSWIMYDNGSVAAPSTGQTNYPGLKGSHPVGTTLGSLHGDTSCSNCHRMHRRSRGIYLQFESGTIQCTTCHNPHMSVSGTKFLIKSNASSALCLSCHDK